jgi:hypothetical protein
VLGRTAFKKMPPSVMSSSPSSDSVAVWPFRVEMYWSIRYATHSEVVMCLEGALILAIARFCLASISALLVGILASICDLLGCTGLGAKVPENVER